MATSQTKNDPPDTIAVIQRKEKYAAHKKMLLTLSRLRGEIQGNQQLLEPNLFSKASQQVQEKWSTALKFLKRGKSDS